MNNEKLAMIEEWMELHPVFMDRLETLPYASESNRNDDYSIKLSVLEKELQIYGVKTCFTTEEFMQVLYNNCPDKDETVKDKDESVKKESKMKGPKKEQLLGFPMLCEYRKITVPKKEIIKIRDEIKKETKDVLCFYSLSEIRTFLRNKAKENLCERIHEKTGNLCCNNIIAVGYYSNSNGFYERNGKFITYHVLIPIKFGEYNIDDNIKDYLSEYEYHGIRFMLNNIWSL
jgi:hypothetical protein